ncbi:single-stranded DNA-binding protein [Priestia flexa]|uniref:single-stranded DNA-binding protein n=1 Tax=Priestia flexa TaxID=86664 RepID=UPI001F4CD08A|nr:single-stranded DNA-binding protein [Priestia flexa]
MMNSVQLIGRLVKDVEMRYTPSGHANTTFTLAVNRKFKNQQTGEREADFINCVAWRGLAETIANNLSKGRELGVIGSWQSRSYEGQDGKRVYVNECVVSDITFIGSKGSNNQSNTNTSQGSQNSYTRDNDPFAGSGNSIDLSDDDLPF